MQLYLDQMSMLLLDEELRNPGGDSEVLTLARARTATVIQRLDAESNRNVIRFLSEAILTGVHQSSISLLAGADLQGAHLEGVDLSTIDLSDAVLKDANLEDAKLSGATLEGAIVTGASLSDANLDGIFQNDFSHTSTGRYRMYDAASPSHQPALIASAGTEIEDAMVEVQSLEDPIPPEFVRALLESIIHQPVPQEFLDTVISESLKLPARVWRDYLEQAVLSIDRDYVVELNEIHMPTLILWGEQDPLFPHEEQERLAAAIPGASLKVYPDTGHAVHWDRPEWVVRDLEEHMKAHLSPSPSARETEERG